MGVRAELAEISPAEFRQIPQGIEASWSGPKYDVQKSWYALHAVFETKGKPLSLAFIGDLLAPYSPHDWDAFCEGEFDWYLAYASPKLVSDIASKLSRVDYPTYQRWERELALDDECGDHWFEVFKQAYINAAANKNALAIMVS